MIRKCDGERKFYCLSLLISFWEWKKNIFAYRRMIHDGYRLQNIFSIPGSSNATWCNACWGSDFAIIITLLSPTLDPFELSFISSWYVRLLRQINRAYCSLGASTRCNVLFTTLPNFDHERIWKHVDTYCEQTHVGSRWCSNTRRLHERNQPSPIQKKFMRQETKVTICNQETVFKLFCIYRTFVGGKSHRIHVIWKNI